MAEEQQFCTFILDRYVFGIEVKQVQEVLRYQELTRVPLASQVVSGLINLRGQIVTAIDLRRRLELNERDDDELPMNVVIMNVVIRTDDGIVSLLVDEIGDVIEVEEDTFEHPPETMRGLARELIKGTYKLEDQLLLILDTEKTVNLNEET